MTQIDSDAALLAVTLVGRDGKRRYDSQSKRRLVEACSQPGVSVAGLALKAGVNANLLRRWIKLHQERNGVAATSEVVENAPAPAPALALPSAFVPVVEISRREVVEHKDAVKLTSEPTRSSPPPVHSQLTVEMPNGVTLRLDCTGQDAPLVSAMIETLGRCDVQARR
jgi:transposase